MSIYTHVNSRDDLLLMADDAYGRVARPAYGRLGWRARVHRVAESNLGLLQAYPWLLDIADDRTALRPGPGARRPGRVGPMTKQGGDRDGHRPA